jgi:hypothetical protein
LGVSRIKFGALQDALMSKWFGRLVQKHYRQVCAELVRDGEIIRDKSTGIEDDTILVFRT